MDVSLAVALAASSAVEISTGLACWTVMVARLSVEMDASRVVDII